MMETSALKHLLFIVFSVLMLTLKAQNFNDSIFWTQENKIDTLIANQHYGDAIIHIENQISYLKNAGHFDSLKRYTYNLGHAYLITKGKKAAISKTSELVAFIEMKVESKSILLEAISDLSWIYIEAGEDSLCFENDKRYMAVCTDYGNASPLEKSTAHYSLGFDYQMLYGNARKAIYHFTEALRPIEKDSLNYKKRVLECLNALGAAYFRNGEYLRSQAYLTRGLNFSSLLPDSIDRMCQQANIYGNLSLNYQDEGNLVKSRQDLHRAIEIRKQILKMALSSYEKAQQERLLISNYHNLSSLYLLIGDISKAEQTSEYVQKLRQQYLAPDHHDHKKSYEAFGSIQLAIGEYDDALANFEKYLSGDIADYGKFSYYTAIGYEKVSQVLFEKGDYAGAIANYSEAIEIGKVITDEVSGQELARGYLQRSMAYKALGDYTAAEMDIREAKKIFLNALPSNSPIIGKVYTLLAGVKSDLYQYDSARYYVDLALSLFLNKQSEQIALYQNNISHFMSYIGDAYVVKAEITLLRSNTPESKKEALESLETAIRYIQKTRNMYDDEAALLNFFTDNQTLFNKTQEIAYSLYAQTGDEKYLNKILQFEEENKSILLRRQLNKFTSLRVVNVPDSIITKERFLQREMAGSIEASGRDMLEIESEYNAILDLIQNEYPEYYNLRYNEFIVDADQIKSELIKPGQNILHYIVADTSVFAVVINTRNTKLVKIQGEGLKERLNALNKSITSISQDSFIENSYYLYSVLFAPIEKYLDGTEVFIIPDQDLFNINFEALVRSPLKVKPEYLVYDYTISYLISSTAAYQYKKLKNSDSKGLLAFAPGFSDDLKSQYVNQVKDSTLFDMNYLRRIQQPFAVSAAADAAGIFNGQSFLSNKATEQNFKDQARKFRIIHFGTHTEINNISPLLSRLVLSKDSDHQNNDDDDDDGYLHVYEIYNIPLRAELAVLTACETGVGKANASEGMLSLARGFAFAGCPSIVMSLWQIDEKTSASISYDFYQNLASGMPKNKALREAKISFLKNNSDELSAPYYWSGLVLLGDAGAIESESQNSPLWILGVFVILILLILSLFTLNTKHSKRSA